MSRWCGAHHRLGVYRVSGVCIQISNCLHPLNIWKSQIGCLSWVTWHLLSALHTERWIVCAKLLIGNFFCGAWMEHVILCMPKMWVCLIDSVHYVRPIGGSLVLSWSDRLLFLDDWLLIKIYMLTAKVRYRIILYKAHVLHFDNI